MNVAERGQPDSAWLDFAVYECLAEIRLRDLSLAARGLWLTLLLLLIQYQDPDDSEKSLPITLNRLSKLVGSHPHTVRKLIAELEDAILIQYDEEGVLTNMFHHVEGSKY